MRTVLLVVAGLALAGCGTTQAQRGLSGAAIGGGVGLLGGPGGILVGAGVGAGIGILTDREDIYLGEPIWE
jgi:osmotically inducible lipoprotein OsmB